jgi:magnesium transporter
MVLGSIAFGGSWLLAGDLRLAAVVGVGVLAVCGWSTCIGAVVPITAHALRIDPTVASAPFISTLVDATGLLIYLFLARGILSI